MARIYVETTIPSFYYNARPELEMVARREQTREWWDKARTENHEFVTSPAVVRELRQSAYPNQKDCIEFIINLPMLLINQEVLDVVDRYVANKAMPADPDGDALHMALASFHACDFLVTWNCKHLANPNKFSQIAGLNRIMNLPVPVVTTPFALLWKP